MKKLVFAAVPAVIAVAAAAGCSSSGSGTPASGGGYPVSSGYYNYNITSTPTNTCWAPPKTTITLPMKVVLSVISTSGTTVFVTASGGAGVSTPIVLARSGNSLNGTTDADVNLNNASTPIDCILHIHAVTSGMVTGTNAFNAGTNVDVSKTGGTQCGVLIGTTSTYQFDALPCTLDLLGNAAHQ